MILAAATAAMMMTAGRSSTGSDSTSMSSNSTGGSTGSTGSTGPDATGEDIVTQAEFATLSLRTKNSAGTDVGGLSVAPRNGTMRTVTAPPTD